MSIIPSERLLALRSIVTKLEIGKDNMIINRNNIYNGKIYRLYKRANVYTLVSLRLSSESF